MHLGFRKSRRIQNQPQCVELSIPELALVMPAWNDKFLNHFEKYKIQAEINDLHAS
ncbi:hypothetical protein LJPFL01_3156 [Lelliottia jeotgali]|nr:hypothetical protein LJPFL01_3156 [Lelliottia jeotgali]